ncbi:flagellar basal body-associated FliL family protein [Hathewaya histolytica]|uniref:Flagellar protein FliL n=1 Tax=Hathewaya histolytica TaxID=1498 RepID=A0A4U9R9I9_HATHI|nr:flagellar basal body-associated FliL family protein [Hathewaya histolytica]VTQ87746.1 Flagellar protein FliL [Hathewaya histolytica]
MAQNKNEKLNNEKGENKLQIVNVALLSLILIGMIAFGTYMFLYKGPNNNKVKNEQASGTVDIKRQEVYSLSDMTSNLADKDSKRYVKIKVALGYKKNDKLKEELDKKKDIISDSIVSVVRNKTADNFNGIGIDSIKKEINTKINTYLNEGLVDNVYFSEILIQ